MKDKHKLEGKKNSSKQEKNQIQYLRVSESKKHKVKESSQCEEGVEHF